MQKVLHPAYFPVNSCGVYPSNWQNFTLAQAMAAYWKVKSWNFSFSNYSGGGGGSFNIIVNVDKMSDLVCSTFSSGSGTGSDEVFTLSGNVSASGVQMEVNCFDDINFYYDSGLSGGSQLVTITIGNEIIITSGTFPSGVSATVTITATSFF
jgi:hypothetical protein